MKLSDRAGGFAPTVQTLIRSGEIGFEESKSAMRKGAGRNKMVFRSKDVNDLAIAEIVRSDDGFSLTTRKALKMSDQITKAAEILDSSGEVFEKSLEKFQATSDHVIGEAKKRVAQINDYSARLGDSLSRLQKTLADPAMSKALENAEKLTQAFEALLVLEQSGNLSKILAALQKS